MNILQWSFHIREIGLKGMNSLFIAEDQHAQHLKDVMKSIGAREGWYLSTCNRIEYIFVLDKGSTPTGPSFTELKPTVRVNIEDVIEHLLDVACAMDSLVFGENQILGQIKKSYNFALEHKLCGSKISKLLNVVLKEAKEIRSETGLNALNTSVAGVSAKIIIKNIKKSDPVLLVGSGETHSLLAQSLIKKGYKNITITNRTDAKAESLAKELGVESLGWDLYKNNILKKYKAISFATPSKTPLLNHEQIKKIKPALVIDLSVPQNVEPQLVKSFGADYFDVEHIQSTLVLEKELVRKIKRAVHARIKIAKQNILNEIRILDLNHLIKESITKSQLVHQALLSDLSPEQKDAVENWSRLLINKINHIHIESLKKYALDKSRNS